jgi:ElaB/YqjD/DUF883 family membrane-anchored ribosome-binding protein
MAAAPQLAGAPRPRWDRPVEVAEEERKAGEEDIDAALAQAVAVNQRAKTELNRAQEDLKTIQAQHAREMRELNDRMDQVESTRNAIATGASAAGLVFGLALGFIAGRAHAKRKETQPDFISPLLKGASIDLLKLPLK